MKRYLACITVVGLLAACTQAQSLRDSRAAGYYVGDQSVDDVVACVSGKWSGKTTHMDAVQLFGGTSLQLRDGEGSMIALVDIVATGSTTTARYHSKTGQQDWYSDQVMDCMHATSSID
jgi:hypothetical protein